jgi:pimeloyl-ACP methyl ester carboxylesterase
MGSFETPDGRTLAYERRGSGPLLVCHPGGPGGSAAEFLDFAGLGDSFELVLLSPRGSHGSDGASDYALASYAADLDLLRDHLGVEQMNLLGFSHGGIVAIAYAAAYPDRLARLVLASAIAFCDKASEQAQAAGIEARRGEPWFPEAERAIADEQAGEFATAADLCANVERQMPLYFHSFGGHERSGRELAADFCVAEPLHYFNLNEWPTLDLRAELRRISAPALVVTGESDFICGPVCARTIAAELPGSQLVLIPEAGHFTYLEQPAAFREAVVGFLL